MTLESSAPGRKTLILLVSGLIYMVCWLHFVPSYGQQKPDGVQQKAVGDNAAFDILPSSTESKVVELPSDYPGLTRKNVRIWYSSVNGEARLLPVLVVKNRRLEQTSDGKLRVIIDIISVLDDDNLAKPFSASLTTAFGAGKWGELSPVGNLQRFSLFINTTTDPRFMSTLIRLKGDNDSPFQLIYEIPKPNYPIDINSLIVNVSETFNGTLSQDAAAVTLTISQEAVTSFKNILGTAPDGQKATLLATFGGEIAQDASVKTLLQQYVNLQISRFQGVEVDSSTLNNIIDKLFAKMKSDVISFNGNQNTVITFLFANGVKATATLGHLHDLSDSEKTHLLNDIRSSNMNSGSLSNSYSTTVDVSGGVPLIASGSVHTNFSGSSATSYANSNQHSQLNDQLNRFSKNISGDLPVTALNVHQIQSAATTSQSSTTVKLDERIYATKTLEYNISLRDSSVVTPLPNISLRDSSVVTPLPSDGIVFAAAKITFTGVLTAPDAQGEVNFSRDGEQFRVKGTFTHLKPTQIYFIQFPLPVRRPYHGPHMRVSSPLLFDLPMRTDADGNCSIDVKTPLLNALNYMDLLSDKQVLIATAVPSMDASKPFVFVAGGGAIQAPEK